jgi:hypothetical protein
MPSVVPGAESSAVPVEDVLPLVVLEPPLVVADTVVMGPVEKPGGEASPHVARMRAARIGLRIGASVSLAAVAVSG